MAWSCIVEAGGGLLRFVGLFILCKYRLLNSFEYIFTLMSTSMLTSMTLQRRLFQLLPVPQEYNMYSEVMQFEWCMFRHYFAYQHVK